MESVPSALQSLRLFGRKINNNNNSNDTMGAYTFLNMQIPAELTDTVTCLSGLYPGVAVFELRANELDGVLHRTEQLAHTFAAVHVTWGQDGLGRCEKVLSRFQDTTGGIEKTVCVF